MTINPIELEGDWNEGYAMAVHTLSSEYLGENEYGKPEFNTVRSELGGLLYDLKYRSKENKASEIYNYISSFLDEWDIKSKIDYIVPVPSSNNRVKQPVNLICERLSNGLEKHVAFDYFIKNSNTQSKNLEKDQKVLLQGSIKRDLKFNKKVNVLLVDDLYHTGGTMNECVRLLREDPNVEEIYVMTITKRRR